MSVSVATKDAYLADVSCHVLALAGYEVLDRRDWAGLASAGGDAELVVVDLCALPEGFECEDEVSPPERVLFVREEPFACLAGMEALFAGVVRAVLPVTAISALPLVVQVASSGGCYMHGDVVALARPLWSLSERDAAVLAAVAERLSNASIARRLGVSEATVKRSVASLVDMFGVVGRRDLAGVVEKIGIPEPPRLPGITRLR